MFRKFKMMMKNYQIKTTNFFKIISRVKIIFGHTTNSCIVIKQVYNINYILLLGSLPIKQRYYAVPILK